MRWARYFHCFREKTRPHLKNRRCVPALTEITGKSKVAFEFTLTKMEREHKTLKMALSVAVLAAGAAVARAQFIPGLTPLEASKPWSISADVRGFYDDNYLTLPK